MLIKIKMIPCVDTRDLPADVEDYCIENDISTHCQNDIVTVEDDGNVLAEWLKAQGVNFTNSQNRDWIDVAIIST